MCGATHCQLVFDRIDYAQDIRLDIKAPASSQRSTVTRNYQILGITYLSDEFTSMDCLRKFLGGTWNVLSALSGDLSCDPVRNRDVQLTNHNLVPTFISRISAVHWFKLF